MPINNYFNDISTLEKIKIKHCFVPSNIDDIINIIKYASKNNLQISMKGQSHTMGGHTLNKDIIIDMKLLNKVNYLNNDTYIAEAGATWIDVIYCLNQYGKTPHTLQSYSNFSVGGSVSANIHGITSDESLIKSIISLRIINSNGEIINCSRNENYNLFKHIVGGYGLFGIIIDVMLKANNNYNISMSCLKLNRNNFVTEYLKLQNNKSILVKIARVNIINLDDINIYIYRKNNNNKIISNLEIEPEKMSIINKLIYKWIVPSFIFQSLRYSYEDINQHPIDWKPKNTINDLMYETSNDMAKLYQPLFKINDTFILQEYFINPTYFDSWFSKFRDIILSRSRKIKLLNITLRFVTKDHESILNYAKNDCIAVVLYFRINKDDDDLLGELQKKLIKITIDYDGTFYLPYRKFYTKNDLNIVYPNITNFIIYKNKYDNNNLFTNNWFNHIVSLYNGTYEVTTKIDKENNNFYDLSSATILILFIIILFLVYYFYNYTGQ